MELHNNTQRTHSLSSALYLSTHTPARTVASSGMSIIVSFSTTTILSLNPRDNAHWRSNTWQYFRIISFFVSVPVLSRHRQSTRASTSTAGSS